MKRQELPASPTPTDTTLGTSPGDAGDFPNPGPHLARILRADQGVLTAAVLLPNTTDLKGTAYTPETVKRAMDGYTTKPAIGLEHKGKPLAKGVSHIASWQTTEDSAFDGHQLPAGTWMMSLLVTDPDLWKKVESGEINGLSIQGTAMVNADDLPALAAMETWVRTVLLLMDEAAKYQFSSVQADLNYTVAERVLEFGRSLVPDEALASVTGRENEPHITVLYGLHTADPEKVREVVEGEPAFECVLGKTRVFHAPDTDVVYIEAFADELHSLNRKLSTLTHTTTHPTYTPHITLAYCKKGEGEKYDGRADLEGTCFLVQDLTFSGRTGNRDWISLRTTEQQRRTRNLEYAQPSL